MAFDPNALASIENAGHAKSSLREYRAAREAGLLSTADALRDYGQAANEYNAWLPSAKEDAATYRKESDYANSTYDYANSLISRFNSNPRNTGLRTAAYGAKGVADASANAANAAADRVINSPILNRYNETAGDAKMIAKKEQKRQQPQGLIAEEQGDGESDNTALSGNNVFSSLAQYRKG